DGTAADRLRPADQPIRRRGRHLVLGGLGRRRPAGACAGGGTDARRRSRRLRSRPKDAAARPDLLSAAARRAAPRPAARDRAAPRRAAGDARTGGIVKIHLVYKCHDLGKMEFYSRFTPLGLGTIVA